MLLAWLVVLSAALPPGSILGLASAGADEVGGDPSSSMSSGAETTAIRLNDGNSMPRIGLGVHQARPGRETYDAVRDAILEHGYRLVDTAAVYQNEADVGAAIRDVGGRKRERVFVTTKLDSDSHGYHRAIAAAEDSLRRLNLTHVDLLLIHSPFGGKIVETWDALLYLRRVGKAKSIGASNFGVKHLEALRLHGRPPPAVNQIEMHPLIYRERLDLVEYCNRHSIAITAYGSLFYGRTHRFDHPAIRGIVDRHGNKKTAAQVLLRWALEHGFAVIPKTTSSKQRLAENFDVFDFRLSPEELSALDDMDGEPLGAYWNPVDDAGVDLGDVDSYYYDSGDREGGASSMWQAPEDEEGEESASSAAKADEL